MLYEQPLDHVRAIAERVVRSYGLELFDVQFRRESIGWVLRVTIDRRLRRGADDEVLVDGPDDGVGIEECQRVSQDLSAVLDVEDAISQHYTLEVSSPGMDRPLRGADDYRRFAGRVAKIVVREALDGQMHFEGRLRGLDGDVVVLAVGKSDRAVRVPLALIARARLGVEF